MQPWVMRPRRSTCVASTMTRPAPELASMPRWARCQSVAVPSSALYWHIGDTTMRLVNSTLPSLMGVKRADMRFLAGAATDGPAIIKTRCSAVFKPNRVASGRANYVRVAIQMTCRAPPRDPLARTLTSSTSKPVLPKPPGEIQIRRRRPHGQYAAGTQRRAGGAQSFQVIQRVVGFSGQCLRDRCRRRAGSHRRPTRSDRISGRRRLRGC